MIRMTAWKESLPTAWYPVRRELPRFSNRGRIVLLATCQDMHRESAATAERGNDVAIYSICCMSATGQGPIVSLARSNKVPANPCESARVNPRRLDFASDIQSSPYESCLSSTLKQSLFLPGKGLLNWVQLLKTLANQGRQALLS